MSCFTLLLKLLKKIVVISSPLLISLCCYAQVPDGLMCDLVGNMSMQSVNGYPINSSFANLGNKNVQSVLIGSQHPTFSWIFNDNGNNTMQTAYQILLSDTPEFLAQGKVSLWDSGKILGSQSTAIVYTGFALKPNTAYYWKVRTWNNHGIASLYSAPVMFFTASILKAHQTPAYPLQITEEKPVNLTRHVQGYLADFGKDAFAQLRLHLFGKAEHDTVVVRLGEVLDASGHIDRKPPGKVRYSQYLLILNRGWSDYQIKISKDAFNTRNAAIKMPEYIGEVTPFRYCEIDRYGSDLKPENLTRLSVHYPFDEQASAFHSSDSTLNAVWDLCKYSIKATSYLGIYVDGDRERTPYEADALINQLGHYAVDREFTMARNSHEYLIEHPTWPTEWILQSVLITWNDYLYTGDIRSARHYYEDLKAKTLVSLEDSTHLISTLNGRLTDQVRSAIHHPGKLKDIVDWPKGSETDDFVFTKYNAVVNAFYYRSLVIMAKLAGDLGKADDATFYKNKSVIVKKAYQQMFFDARRGIYVDGTGTSHASLHANAFALALGLVDSRFQKSVLAWVRSKGMACSVYGSQFLLDGVYDAGDGAYGLWLLTQKTDRSWFNMIRVGSTITLEAWDNKYKSNQDWNHAWGAAPANVIVRKLMGIEPLSPGWGTFSIRPQIGDLQSAEIKVPTIKGSINALYRQTSDTFDMDIKIPANTSANVYLPRRNARTFDIWLDKSKIKITKTERGLSAITVGSGRHLLKIRYGH